MDRVRQADEVWHAGDWGGIELADQITGLNKTLRAVYGNIDGTVVRKSFGKEVFFECEGLKVYMTHIGGYPGRYQREVKEKLERLRPELFICGHSHILKVVRDNKLGLMHFNPGAIGLKGFHKKRTALSFLIENGTISDVNVLEYEKRFDD